MSDRERAREMLTLLWGECDYDQAATAIAAELAQARAEGLRQAADKVEALADDEGPEGETLQSAYNDHPPKTYVNDRLRAYHKALAARIRALIKEK